MSYIFVCLFYISYGNEYISKFCVIQRQNTFFMSVTYFFNYILYYIVLFSLELNYLNLLNLAQCFYISILSYVTYRVCMSIATNIALLLIFIQSKMNINANLLITIVFFIRYYHIF